MIQLIVTINDCLPYHRYAIQWFIQRHNANEFRTNFESVLQILVDRRSVHHGPFLNYFSDHQVL
jgi:hypothetical protein